MRTTLLPPWANGACNNRCSAVKHSAVKDLCVHHLEPLNVWAADQGRGLLRHPLTMYITGNADLETANGPQVRYSELQPRHRAPCRACPHGTRLAVRN